MNSTVPLVARTSMAMSSTVRGHDIPDSRERLAFFEARGRTSAGLWVLLATVFKTFLRDNFKMGISRRMRACLKVFYIYIFVRCVIRCFVMRPRNEWREGRQSEHVAPRYNKEG